jgi:hypothetical protein
MEKLSLFSVVRNSDRQPLHSNDCKSLGRWLGQKIAEERPFWPAAASTVPDVVNRKWCAELPYGPSPASCYEHLKYRVRKHLGNPYWRLRGNLDKVFGANRLPILHSSAVGLTCQRCGFDQASDQLCDRKVGPQVHQGESYF